MEQTIGKRIMEHRKRMGLTQDQLAEKLGITAQAISKWENDLSCPDIAMLPKLAEIFGISTDALLGMEPREQVHQAEVVDEENTDSGIFNFSLNSHDGDGKWTFRWDSGRKNAVFFAIWVLLVGVVYLLSKWYNWDVSFWSILWPSCLLIFGIAGSFPKFSVFSLGAAILGGYFLVHNLGLWQLDIAGELIFPICIVLFGISLLLDALHKPKKSRFHVTHKGGNSKKTQCDCRNTEDSFECSLSFGENTHHVDLPQLHCGEASVSFGELTVDLTGCSAVAEDCSVEATCSFGSLCLLVPRRFAVQTESSTAFASVGFIGQPDSNPQGVIHLEASASFGEITVKYV